MKKKEDLVVCECLYFEGLGVPLIFVFFLICFAYWAKIARLRSICFYSKFIHPFVFLLKAGFVPE